jgi:hypothetical protein
MEKEIRVRRKRVIKKEGNKEKTVEEIIKNMEGGNEGKNKR